MGTLKAVVARFSGEDAPPEYACRSCDTGYDVQHHVCPSCGGYSVERVDW